MLFNPNAGRLGKHTQLQFNDRGRLTGVKMLDYCLECALVAGVPSGRRNFLSSTTSSPARRSRGACTRPLRTRALLLPRRADPAGDDHPGRRAHDKDAKRFKQLKLASQAVGLSKRHVCSTCQLLAVILHLSNIEFVDDGGRNPDTAVVRNTDVLDVAAEFLGVRAPALEAVLSYRMKTIKKELVTVFLDPGGAADNRNDLAKALYSLLFAWLNEHIDQKPCCYDFSTLLTLVDLPGPQNSTAQLSGPDQFIVNLADDRLHGFVQTRLFENHAHEYEAEGLGGLMPHVPYLDNAECVRLLTNMSNGFAHIMDDQARCQPKKGGTTMVEASAKRWGNHSSFEAGAPGRSGVPTFTVSHYHGPVTYAADGFLKRNLKAINPEFVSLLRGMHAGGEGGGFISPFVKVRPRRSRRKCTHVTRRRSCPRSSPLSRCARRRRAASRARRSWTLTRRATRPRPARTTTTRRATAACRAARARCGARSTRCSTRSRTRRRGSCSA
jgi:chitin synthase